MVTRLARNRCRRGVAVRSRWGHGQRPGAQRVGADAAWPFGRRWPGSTCAKPSTVCANGNGVLIRLSRGTSHERLMASAFASDGAGERLLADEGRLPPCPASGISRVSRVSRASRRAGRRGGTSMIDTHLGTMAPDRRDGTERLDPPFLAGKLRIPAAGLPRAAAAAGERPARPGGQAPGHAGLRAAWRREDGRLRLVGRAAARRRAGDLAHRGPRRPARLVLVLRLHRPHPGTGRAARGPAGAGRHQAGRLPAAPGGDRPGLHRAGGAAARRRPRGHRPRRAQRARRAHPPCAAGAAAGPVRPAGRPRCNWPGCGCPASWAMSAPPTWPAAPTRRTATSRCSA